MHPEEYYPQVTVSGLVVANDGDILLIRSKEWNDHYALPDGKVHLGEAREPALCHALKEKCGLEVVSVQYALTIDSIFSDEYYRRSHFVIHEYVCKLSALQTKEDVLLQDDSDDFVWVPPFEAQKLLLTKEAQVFIQWYIYRS